MLIFHPAILLLGIYPRKTFAHEHKLSTRMWYMHIELSFKINDVKLYKRIMFNEKVSCRILHILRCPQETLKQHYILPYLQTCRIV